MANNLRFNFDGHQKVLFFVMYDGLRFHAINLSNALYAHQITTKFTIFVLRVKMFHTKCATPQKRETLFQPVWMNVEHIRYSNHVAAFDYNSSNSSNISISSNLISSIIVGIQCYNV